MPGHRQKGAAIMDVSYGNVPEGAVWAGIDTHADTNWLSVVDARGRELRSEQLPATADGCRQAAEIILAMGAPVSVGVECTGSYGAGIARELSARGIRCYEVVTPGRPGRGRGCSKDDAADALRAALQALSGRDLAVPKARNGWVEGVRALCVVRESLVRACTSYANLGIAIVREAPDPVRSAFAGLGAAGIMRRCASSGMPAGCSGVAGAVMLALCRLSEAWLQAKKSADELERRIAEMVRAGNPALSSMYGCGPIAAAALAIAAGDNPERMHSEAAFAALCGVSPLRASSGKTRRHRLSRGGDRRANRALHVIAIHRMRTDPRTIAYAERRRREGLSDREIRRCLKRYIAREAYRCLMHPFDLGEASAGPELRYERIAAGVTQKAAASALGVTASTLCDLELGHHQFRELAQRYRRWIDDGFPMNPDKGPNGD